MATICLYNLIQNRMQISSKRLIRRHILVLTRKKVNPLVTNGLSHRYHLDESTFILGESGVIFMFYLIFESCVSKQKAPDETPRFAASPLVLFCLPMSHKRTQGLYVLIPSMVCRNEIRLIIVTAKVERTFLL